MLPRQFEVSILLVFVLFNNAQDFGGVIAQAAAASAQQPADAAVAPAEAAAPKP
jgi:hypothetical protein